MTEDVWISAGVGLGIAMLFVLALLVPRNVRPSRTAEAKLDDVRHRLDEVERQQRRADHDLRNMRMTIAGLATKDSVNTLTVSVAEMRGEVKGLITNTAATTRSIERIEDFLMKSTADVIARSAEGRS